MSKLYDLQDRFHRFRNLRGPIRCWFNRHTSPKGTVGGYLRCYECGNDYIEGKGWVNHTYLLGYFRLTGRDGLLPKEDKE